MDGMGLSHIAEGYNGLPDKFRVLALSDIDPKRLHTVSEQFSIPRATVSFELLPMPDPDIIDICTHPPVPWTGQHPDRRGCQRPVRVLYSAGTRSNHGCAVSSSAASARRVASSP